MVNRTRENIGSFAAGADLFIAEFRIRGCQLDHSQLQGMNFAQSRKDFFSYNLGKAASIRVTTEAFERLDSQDCPGRPKQLTDTRDSDIRKDRNDDRGGGPEEQFWQKRPRPSRRR